MMSLLDINNIRHTRGRCLVCCQHTIWLRSCLRLSFADVFTCKTNIAHPVGRLDTLPPSLLLTHEPAVLKLFSLSAALLGCTLNRQDVRLTLHYEKGFTVTREPADPAGGAVLFRYPYEKLKMSADDGIRNLYLDFGGPEGEMVS